MPMEPSEIRRRAVLVEQSAFRACNACTGGAVGHDPEIGIVCGKDPMVARCDLLRVNALRTAIGAPAEAMLAEMTEDWAMARAGGTILTPAPPAPLPSAAPAPAAAPVAAASASTVTAQPEGASAS
jgi:hypothetical protein